VFITFEGIEGSGKSTQIRRLAAGLPKTTVVTREPGGTPLGTRLREALLDRDGRVTPRAEVLLFFADRAQHVAEVIRPALERGAIVLCDRFEDSTLAYQGFGRELPMGALRAVGALATGGLRPDVTVLLDVGVETGFERVGRRGGADRMESEERAFHERVRQGFLTLAGEDKERFLVLDGSRPPEEVARLVREGLGRRGVRFEGVHAV
jgi:dTMP kinase